MSDTTKAQDERPPWHDVKVHWPDGRTHLDGIRGHDREQAIDAAQWNWGAGSPYGRAERIEYLGVADDQDDPADGYTPTDWWGDDYPDTAGATA